MDTERFHSMAKEALVEKIAQSFPDEVTHNGDKKQLYVDMYEKASNTCINYL